MRSVQEPYGIERKEEKYENQVLWGRARTLTCSYDRTEVISMCGHDVYLNVTP